MADIAMYVEGVTHQSVGGNVAKAYVVNSYVDLAEAATSKGSALAQGDIIQALYIPAGSQVLFAGIEVMEAMTGTSTDATIDFGRTSPGDPDAWVDGFDLDGAAAGAYATVATTAVTPAKTFTTAADTLDVLIATQTGTITGGVLRVFAHVVDLSDPGKAPGLVQLGS